MSYLTLRRTSENIITLTNMSNDSIGAMDLTAGNIFNTGVHIYHMSPRDSFMYSISELTAEYRSIIGAYNEYHIEIPQRVRPVQIQHERVPQYTSATGTISAVPGSINRVEYNSFPTGTFTGATNAMADHYSAEIMEDKKVFIPSGSFKSFSQKVA